MVCSNCEQLLLDMIVTTLTSHQVAGKATYNDPPSELLSSGDVEARLKPRGLNGPRPASVTQLTSGGSAVGDFSTMITATMLPMAIMCVQQMTETFAARRSEPVTAVAVPSTNAPKVSRAHVAAGDEVTRCLQDFLSEQSVDLTAFDAALLALDFTPDLIPRLSIPRLLEVFDGIAEGTVLKFQLFAQEWSAWLINQRSLA
jgi:hypothetical protein